MFAKFSRNGSTSLLGKLTAELPKTRVSEKTFEILKQKAHTLGLPLAEYLRQKAEIDAHGIDTISRLQQDRLNLVARIGNE
jgi:hypothetical protein